MLNKQRVFLIDLDNTLINSKMVNKATLKSININLPNYYKTYTNKYVKTNNGRIREFPKSLYTLAVGKDKINNTLNNIDYTNCLYKDVITTLSKLNKLGKLILFTTGNKLVQNNKIKQTNIEKFFTQKIISDNKNLRAKAVIKIFEGKKIIVIDDKLQVLDCFKKLCASVTTVWIKQGYHANKTYQPEFKPDYQTSSFSKLLKLGCFN